MDKKTQKQLKQTVSAAQREGNFGSGAGKWTKVSELSVGMKIAVPKNEIGVGTDDVLWDEIVAINHIGRERVYDIEVEGTHNFVGNDIFAHNTYINNDLIKISASNLDVGDIVRPASGSQRFVIATTTDENQVAGVVTDTPAISGTASTSIAFSGQAVVKVSAENGPIKVGDRLALSHTQPGVAVKAVSAGMTVGVALEDVSSASNVLTLVNVGYWVPSADTLAGAVASGSAQVTVSSGFGASDVLTTLANAVMTRVQSIWASGDVITEGVKKTYFATVSTLQGAVASVSDAISSWTTRDIAISNTASDTVKSLLSGTSAQAADNSKVNLADNGNYLATYGVDSTRGEIQLSGSSQIINGEAKVFFDYSFSSIISDTTPIKLIVTPTSIMQGQLYTDSKSSFGFVVKELNGSDTGTFDWLVIARRKGFEDAVVTPSATPTATPDATVSPTPTPDATVSPTPTPTPDATVSPTPTPDATVSPTPTPTPTPDVTVSPTPTPTPDATPTPTP